MIKLAQPFISNDEIRSMADVLKSGQLTQANWVQKFEKMVSEKIGTRHAIAVSSGTAALHLALKAIGIQAGDEVIVPDFNFPAVTNVVQHLGGIPFLVDVDETFNMQIEGLEKAITQRTKAIVPVHLFGCPADMDPIVALAKKHHLFIIEDAACALGATYKGIQCGAIGDIGCFSFHPRKHITTGEGGMVVTNNDSLAKKIKMLRNHGLSEGKGQKKLMCAGFNYRMSEIEGVLGVVQMNKIKTFIQKRIQLSEQYNRLLGSSLQLKTPLSLDHFQHIYQSYVVWTESTDIRDKLIEFLKQHEVESTLGTYALSSQPHFSGYSNRMSSLKNSKQAYETSLALPCHVDLARSDIERISNLVLQCLRR